MAWDLSCKDWQTRIRDGRPLIPDLPLNRAEADRAVGIFNKLRIPDVVGQPTLAEAGGDWFRQFVAAVFGSVDAESGERHIREAMCLVPKKNSKTTNGAALMLVALLMNRRPRAEFLLVGPTKEVADLAFSQAVGMIDADDEGFLQKRFHVREHVKEIVDRRTKARLKIKSFDAKVLTGVKPAGVLLDELHEIAKDAAAERVIGQIRGGLLPNPEAFLIFITTQSDTPPRGAFKAELATARAIRDGKAKGAMLPVLYEFPDAIARVPVVDGKTPPWADPALWWMVTPNRDKSIRIERLAEEFATAQTKGLQEVVRWASQHLNIEIGVGLHADAWVAAPLWPVQAEEGLGLDEILLRSEVVVAGIDGGGLDDLLSLAIIGRDKDDPRHWMQWQHSWAAEIVLARRPSEASVLRDFERAGELTIVPAPGPDIDDLVDILRRVDETGLLARVGLDPAGVGAIVDALAEVGIGGTDDTEDSRVVGVSQGFQLQGAVKTAERKLADGTLTHCGQAIMSWAVGNAKVEQRGNAILITKAAAGVAKIDPLMATFDAVALMAKNPQPPKPAPTYQMFFV